MNKKIARGCLAGVAVVALAAGGGTFAAWSDFDSIDGNSAGAEELTLNLNEFGSQTISKMNLAPGVNTTKQFLVSSRQGDTVPVAKLSVALKDLVGTEDGCTSTNSEEAVDPNCDAAVKDQGEFIKEAEIRFYSSVPKTDAATACSSNTGPAVTGWIKLDQSPTADLGTLEKGQSRCILAEVRMPSGASNASQGDSATFDLDFLLEQVL